MNALGNQSLYFIRDLVHVEGNSGEVEYNLGEDILDLQGKRFEINKQKGQDDLSQPYKPTSVIVYRDGILFVGESNNISSKIQGFFSRMQGKSGKKEWKKLLFAEMKSMLVLGDELRIRMNNDYTCNFRTDDSKNDTTWEPFICFVYKNVKPFANLLGGFKGHHYSCVKNNVGGKRKTKRNKKSKRRTRRY